jgi:hypothetical protein
MSEFCCLKFAVLYLWGALYDERMGGGGKGGGGYFATVSQYVLLSSTLVELDTRCYFLSECCCLKFAVLYLWGALYDERMGGGGKGGGGYFATVSQYVLLSSTLVELIPDITSCRNVDV